MRSLNKKLSLGLVALAVAVSCFAESGGGEALEPPEVLGTEIYITEGEMPGYQRYRDANDAFPRDPRAALVFSALAPGLGHMYTGNVYKGALLAAVFTGSMIIAVQNLRVVQGEDGDWGINGDKGTGSVASAAALLTYFFSAQDAYKSARKYNSERGFKFLMEARSERVALQLSYAY